MNVKYELEVDCLKVVNYAIQQNRIPLFRGIRLFNGSDTALSNGSVHLSFSPEFAEDVEIPLGELKAGAGVTVRDLPVRLSGEYLSSMTESVTGQITATLLGGDVPVCACTIPIEILTYDEWPGPGTCPEILASFVTPNHPAILPVVRRASEILHDWGLNEAMDAYHGGNPEKVKYMMAAIYEAIKEYGISYCWLPASYFPEGQRIRLAHTVFGNKLACCLDMACLYTGCLEAVGLNPLVIIQDDHAFAGCHLVSRSLQDPCTDDASLLMKLCADGINEMMMVETTGMTEGCMRPFDEAVTLAEATLTEIDKFQFAVDIKRSRLANVLPLPLSVDGRVDPALMTSRPCPAEQPQCLGGADTVDPDAAVTVTKQHVWERHLLDLSLKNRLLNTRLSNEAVQLMAHDLQALEEAVASGRELRISHLPVEWVAAGAKPATFHHIAPMDPVRELIAADLKQSRLHAFLNEGKMQGALKQLSYASRTSREESGANSLYLAIGLMRLTDADTGTPIHAPVILYPVDLVKKSAASGYIVKGRDEDPVLNTTLMEYLRQFHQIRVGGLDPLPKEGCGVDVSMILNTFRKAVLHKKGWDVEEHVVLGIFSFSKQVMWNDIHSNAELFASNPIVRSLMDGRLDPSVAGFRDEGDGTPVNDPSGLILPLDADSSQKEVIASAIAGESFVIQGAPGTGKSQTIANIIANMLDRGKRVLFVSEKQAALDVVMKRLEAVGISDVCLALHSNKASKSSVLEHFKRLLDMDKDLTRIPYEEHKTRLSGVEGELGNHVEAINRIHPAGYSLNDCLSGYLSSDAPVIPGLATGDWDAAALERRIAALEDYKNACGVVEHPEDHPFTDSVLTTLPSEDLRPGMERLLDDLKALEMEHAVLWYALFPTAVLKCGKPDLEAFARLCGLLESWNPENPALLLELERGQVEAVKGALSSAARHQKNREAILARYNEAVLGLTSWDLKNRLAEVMSKDCLSRYVCELKLRNEIKECSLTGRRPGIRDIADLADALAELESDARRLRESASLLTSIFGDRWNTGRDDNGIGMTSNLETSLEIRKDLEALSSSPAEYQEMCGSLSVFVQSGSSDMKAEAGVFPERVRSLRDACQGVFSALGANPVPMETGTWFAAVRSSVGRWLANYGCLRDWVIYNSNRVRVIGLGLEKLVGMVERGEMERSQLDGCLMRSFYASYADHIIASDPCLALFHGLIFEEKADKYRRLHEEVRKLSCAELRSRLLRRIPSMRQEATNGKEAGILQKCIRNGCRGISLRSLFAQIPGLLSRMCPCMLMSPLSVAQYLTADVPRFDLVIFDEASQVPTCEAVGAIARGHGVVVVGDPNQMPPSDFFTVDSFDEENAHMEDLESILDDCLALSMPSRRLLWHYRSKHESLIAFSNMHFYDNKLLTFPSVDDLSPRLHFQFVEGSYDRGRTRQNAGEAEAVVEEIKRRLSNPAKVGMSIGVVTFNSNQQSLIEDRLNEMFRKNPTLEKAASRQAEPIFIKNLENVQGDERDVILFSVGYGLDGNGFMSLNFGPLNREGGWRRLNVAVSRARYEMKVFSTITADKIDLNRSSSAGVAGLKAFLEYAEKGREALRYDAVVSADTDDGIVLSIADDLRREGFDVRTNIGCSGYRIDLGIVDPRNPERYVAGVLCDGYNYAAAKTTGDREIIQVKVLGQLGWNIRRVWALDYWSDRARTISRLAGRLKDIVDTCGTTVEVGEQAAEVLKNVSDVDDQKPESVVVEREVTPDVCEQGMAPKGNEAPDVIPEGDSEDGLPSAGGAPERETIGEVPGIDETETILREMLKDSNEYELKPFFAPVMTALAENGFRGRKQVIDSLVMQFGEMPSAAVDAINEAFYGRLGDNLITEDGEEYVMDSYNYETIKEDLQ